MNVKPKILIVDDEEDIVEFLKYNLEKEGFEVSEAYDGEEAMQVAKKEIPHIMLLDIMMPISDGFETCKKLREIRELQDMLICFLTAKGENSVQIDAFNMGGDDFVTKPIKPNVLISRIKALLRRHKTYNIGENNKIVKYGELTIDFEKIFITVKGEQIILARKEFELLTLLASIPGKVFKREEIMMKIWGNDVIVGDRTLDVHIRKLREKIGDNYIVTLKGVGYKFEF